MSLTLSHSGSSRPALVSTGITLLHLGVFGILAAQTTTPVALPEVTPVQLIALAPEAAPTPPAPEPAAAPAPPKPEKLPQPPARKSPPKPAIKTERKPEPTPRAETPARKEQPAQTAQADSRAESAPHSETQRQANAGQGQAQSEAPAAPAVELPSTRASYLNNPKPPYPASSKRLGETGTVLLRVLVGADGSAERVSLKKSSGFDALDTSALETVRRWRFVPGKRNGVPAAMEYTVPIAFRLE